MNDHIKRVQDRLDQAEPAPIKSILQEADDIINNRSEEKAREYGDFSESMASAARIASELTGKDITTEDFFKCLVALKMGRMRYNYKRDTFVDAVAYVQGLSNFLNQ